MADLVILGVVVAILAAYAVADIVRAHRHRRGTPPATPGRVTSTPGHPPATPRLIRKEGAA